MFRIVTADGREFVGRVHGSGGEIAGGNALARLTIAKARAESGKASPLYEPKPGHVAMYLGRAWDVPQVAVALAGSTIARSA